MKARLIVTIVITLGLASADALSRQVGGSLREPPKQTLFNRVAPRPDLAEANQQATFKGASESVRVFVTVMDRDGRLVPNLKQEAFEVRDEGKPQMITVFDNTPQP